MTDKRNILSTFLSTLIIACVVLLSAEIGTRIYLFCTGGYIWIPDHFLGVTHPPNSRFIYSENIAKEFSNKHKTNSLGLLGNEIAVKKPANVFRILILGDSFTEALQVKEGKSFCEQLELLLNKNRQAAGKRFEVINAGVSSYSPICEYLLFKRELTKLSPDIVILQLFANDIFEDNKTKAMSVMDGNGMPVRINKFFTSESMIMRPNPEKSQQVNEFIYKIQKNILNRSAMFQVIYRALQKSNKKSRIHKQMTMLEEFNDDNQFFIIQEANPLYQNKSFMEKTWNNTQKYILAIKDLASELNAQFFLFYIPPEAQLKLTHYGEASGYFHRYHANNNLNDKLLKFSQEKGVKYLDLLPIFENNKDKGLYYNWDGHMKENGHNLVTQALFEYLFK